MADARLYDLAISFLLGVGDVNAKKLLSYFGSAKNVFNASLSELKKIPGIGEHTALKIYKSFSYSLNLAEEELFYIYANDIDFVSFCDIDYPVRLKECNDAPMVLYYKGNTKFNSDKIISIVGTRKATNYGIDFCTKFITDIAKKHPEVVVVSGLAFGIDIVAHKEALNNGLKTWAVLGHSLETIYPVKHKTIAQKIISSEGAIISDYCHGSKIDPVNFVKRNRIVAGLCDAIIIVESGIKGGSIVTANIANNYNKDVFAVPGNINSANCAGCNNLIKTNRAHLIDSVNDLEYIMNWETDRSSKNQQKTLSLIAELNENEKIIIDTLKNYDYLDIDNISRQTNLSSDVLSLCLLELEFKNIIKALPGKIFTLLKY